MFTEVGLFAQLIGFSLKMKRQNKPNKKPKNSNWSDAAGEQIDGNFQFRVEILTVPS